MKLNINGKEVELFVNGEKQSSLANKGKLSDKNMSADEIIKKAKELKELGNAKD